jgi:hypothetical protein
LNISSFDVVILSISSQNKFVSIGMQLEISTNF